MYKCATYMYMREKYLSPQRQNKYFILRVCANICMNDLNQMFKNFIDTQCDFLIFSSLFSIASLPCMFSFLGFYNPPYPINAAQTLPGMGSVTLFSLAATSCLQFLKQRWGLMSPSLLHAGILTGGEAKTQRLPQRGEEIVNSDVKYE